jgi:hypothetical protein
MTVLIMSYSGYDKAGRAIQTSWVSFLLILALATLRT